MKCIHVPYQDVLPQYNTIYPILYHTYGTYSGCEMDIRRRASSFESDLIMILVLKLYSCIQVQALFNHLSYTIVTSTVTVRI